MARWNLIQLRLADVTDETLVHPPLRLAVKDSLQFLARFVAPLDNLTEFGGKAFGGGCA